MHADDAEDAFTTEDTEDTEADGFTAEDTEDTEADGDAGAGWGG